MQKRIRRLRAQGRQVLPGSGSLLPSEKRRKMLRAQRLRLISLNLKLKKSPGMSGGFFYASFREARLDEFHRLTEGLLADRVIQAFDEMLAHGNARLLQA